MLSDLNLLTLKPVVNLHWSKSQAKFVICGFYAAVRFEVGADVSFIGHR